MRSYLGVYVSHVALAAPLRGSKVLAVRSKIWIAPQIQNCPAITGGFQRTRRPDPVRIGVARRWVEQEGQPDQRVPCPTPRSRWWPATRRDDRATADAGSDRPRDHRR